MPRVCIVQYNASRFLTRVDRAARALAGAGHEVTLVAIRDETTPEIEQRQGYVVRRVTLGSRRFTRRYGLRYVRFAEGLWRTFRAALAEDADIYDARDAYPLLASWLAAKLRGARVVYDADELATGRNLPHASNPLYARAIRAYEGFFCRRVDAVITSDVGRADVMESLHRIPRPTVVLNVAEVPEDLAPDTAFGHSARGDRRYLLVYQGVVIANRGLPELIEAMRALPDCRLAIVGAGSLLETLKEQVDSAGLRGAVAFFDPVPFETLMRYIAAADVGVIPIIGSCESYRTAAPNKLFECMAVGIPVVASDLPDMARIVRETGCGTLIADPTDPGSIVTAVRELLDGPTSLREVGERGRRAARETYNWGVERTKLLAVFDRLPEQSGVVKARVAADDRATEMSQRPTVCHVTSVHQPLDARVLYHECRSLATRYRTVLVCRDDGPSRSVEGVEIVTVPRARGRIRRFAARRELIEVAEALAAGLYHFHDPELMEPMLDLGRRTGRPVIYDVHEDYPSAMDQKAWIPSSLRPAAARWADTTERRCAPRYAAVVVADAALRRRFAALNSDVVELDNYPPLAVLGEELTPPEGRPTMVYVGSISAARGFEEMVAVLEGARRRLPDARLVVYGRPAEGIVPRISGAALSFPPGVLEFRGPVPYADLRTALREAGVGLSLLRPHPKYEKNVSMKVFDYMALGVPWVASDFPPLRDATGEAGGILVPPGDVEAAIEAVVSILADRERARALSRAGRAAVEARLSWEVVEPRLFALYDRLLGTTAG